MDAGGGGEVMDAVSDELRTIMRARRHLAPGASDSFTIDTSATFQNLLGKILNNFGAVVAAIAGMSLVIGGIVIMNIMLVQSPSAPAKSACARRSARGARISCCNSSLSLPRCLWWAE